VRRPHLLRHEIPEGGVRWLIVPAAVARAILHQLSGAFSVVPEHCPSDSGDVIVSHCMNLDSEQTLSAKSAIASERAISRATAH
jgi:hypothetical protein